MTRLMKRLHLMMAFALLLALFACEQQIVQTTNVPAPVVHVHVPSPAPGLSTSASAPVKTPGPLRSASPIRPAAEPTALATPLPVLRIEPISGPSAPSRIPANLDLFADSIPEPESTRSYDLQSSEFAALLWQQRYEAQRQDPYQVMKMYLDAGMIAWYNEALAARLNGPLLTSKTPWLFPNYAARDAGALAKSKEYAVRSYFRGTRAIDNYALPDFATRTVNVVSKNSRGDYVEFSPQDARSLAPAMPRSGDVVRYKLYSSASGKEVELTLVYQDKGWKVDFWTPNILVLFLG